MYVLSGISGHFGHYKQTLYNSSSMLKQRFAILLWKSLFWANWLVIAWFWWTYSGSILFQSVPNAAVAIGRLAGLSATYMILLQFFFMGRTPWLERVFGLDTLSRMHHKNGKRGFLFLLLHPLLIVWGNGAMSEVSFVAQLASLLGIDEIMLAAAALVLFSIVVASSIYIARTRLRYESWYAVHLLTYAAVFLALPHQIELGTTILSSDVFYAYWVLLYIVVFAHHAVFRIMRPFVLFHRHRFFVQRIERETHDTVSVYIGGTNLDAFPVRPGQFMIVRFLTKGFRWQAHPFSLSTVPNGKQLRITVKELGDFTRNIASVPMGTKIFIDGPYGVFTDLFAMSHKALFIAGGIGITPIRSLMEEMLQKGKDTVLLFANRTEKDIIFRDELARLSQTTSGKIVHILSNQSDFPGEKGRLDAEKILDLVPDVTERDIYLCGPVPMMDTVIAALKQLNVPLARIHYERFSL